MLTIELPPDVEKRLQGEATRQGLAAEDYVKKLIVENLPSHETAQSLTDLFAEWEAEDATDDPAEIARRNREVEELLQALDRNRREMEGEGSRKLLP